MKNDQYRSLEDRFSNTLHIPVHKEEASFGACTCAIAGSGEKSIFDAGEMISYI